MLPNLRQLIASLQQRSFRCLLMFSVCSQPYAAGYDVFSDRPVLKAWKERVRQQTQPFFDEAHVMNYRLYQTFSKKSKL